MPDRTMLRSGVGNAAPTFMRPSEIGISATSRQLWFCDAAGIPQALGLQGPPGAAGTPGLAGAAGATGAAGAAGPVGPAGTFSAANIQPLPSGLQSGDYQLIMRAGVIYYVVAGTTTPVITTQTLQLNGTPLLFGTIPLTLG